jgi:RND family efflux transporter MFP subunit
MLIGCGEESEPSKPPRLVKAMRVVGADSLSARSLPGRASPGQEVNLSFRVSGQLEEFPLSVGDRVEAGQIVASIDARDYESRLLAARGEHQTALANYERAEALVKENVLAPLVRDQRRAAADTSEGALQLAEKAVADTRILAPFDGTVAATYVENFETIVAKQAILRLVDTTTVEFIVSVPESLIGYAPRITQIEVTFDALPGVKVPARLKEIGREATQATRTYPVTLAMEQPEGVEILSGMAGEARIEAELPEGDRQIGISIPATALFTGDDPSLSYVWVIDPVSRKLARRQVEMGDLSEFGLLLRSGLEPGEEIVVSGVSLLDEGQEVVPIGDGVAGSRGDRE